MPEIFPAIAPGNFTWDEAMGKWVMTVFNNYQWDLNYHNPSVLIEMIDIILFWANKGTDILRLDAVAFLWKKNGLKKMIALRKETPAFADFDNRHLFAVNNPNLPVYSRTTPQNSRNKVLVVSNFNVEAQTMSIAALKSYGLFLQDDMRDLCSGLHFVAENDEVVLPALSCCWLTD